MSILRVLFFVSLVMMGGWRSVALAQDYPRRPITLIVPFVAGGSSDIFARAIAQRLEKKIGQSVVIENRGGASGAIGTAAAAKAAPDGYTILLGHTTALTVLPHLRKDLGYVPERDFKPVTLIGAVPQVLVVHPTVARTLDEFIKRAKAEPGKLNYASGGVATPPHLAAELFKQQAHVDIVHVPFNGSAPATNALLGGHVHAAFQNVDSILPHIKAGKVVPLAVAAEKRSPHLPDVPTFEEAGIPGVVNKTWFGLVAPAGVPGHVLNLLRDKSRAIVESEDFKSFLSAQISEHLPAGSDAFEVFLKEENERWSRVLQRADLRVN